jgi:hypothetical protein
MRKDKLKLKPYGRITAIVILLNFLMTFQALGEPLTTPLPNLTESVMRLYSESEVDTLIDDLTAAAHGAIEQAAGEAAKAAVLALLEREAAAIREATRQQAEAQRWRIEADLNFKAIAEAKKKGVKNTFKAGGICLVSGLVIGFFGTLIIGGR